MAVLLGEWLYNLRCALDYAVFATALYDSGTDPPPEQGSLPFPIYTTEQLFVDDHYRLKGLSDYHRDELLEPIQPYHCDDIDASALLCLHRLARNDRHRRLHVLSALPAESNPEVVVHTDKPHTVLISDHGRAVVDESGEAEIAQFLVEPWNDSWRVEVNPHAGLDPEIVDWSQWEFWRGIDYNKRLPMLTFAVECAIAPLEYDCTGWSRRKRLLSESFIAESDDRRQERRTTKPDHISRSLVGEVGVPAPLFAIPLFAG
jgi:hypothetical protein